MDMVGTVYCRAATAPTVWILTPEVALEIALTLTPELGSDRMSKWTGVEEEGERGLQAARVLDRARSAHTTRND
jgi:hypothetical protein